MAQQIIENDRPVITIYNPTTIAVFNTNLSGVHLSANRLIRVENAQYR